MARLIIKVRVAYPNTLLNAFNSQSAERRSAGERGVSICFNPDDPNITYFFLDWDSVFNVRTFWLSSAAKAQMIAWNPVGAPDVLVLEELAQT